MSAPYTVSWFDRAGQIGSSTHSIFAKALEAYHSRQRQGLVAIMSADGCEHDGERWHDGLTEEEREQL